MSAPHFFKGSPSLLTNISGLNPVRELHEAFFEVEPVSCLELDLQIADELCVQRTGLVLKARGRIQLNVQIRRFEQFASMGNVDDRRILPVAWFEESVDMDETSKELFERTLLSRERLLNRVSIGLMIAGLIVFTITIVICGVQ